MLQRIQDPQGRFASISALIYAVAGLAGFVVTGFDSSAEDLLGFAINPAHNVVHLALAGCWAAAILGRVPARPTNAVLGVGLIAASVLGFADLVGFLAIDHAGEPDNMLHLGYGLLCLLVAARVPSTADAR